MRLQTGQIIAAVDLDYLRGTRAYGKTASTNAPETHLAERAGIVWRRIERVGESDIDMVDIGSEIVAGQDVASQTVRKLVAADLVVGHGLLVNDYRALHMVTRVPPSLTQKTADTLLVFRDERKAIRKSNFPTGLSLSTLTALNLPSSRSKPAVSSGRYRHLDDPYFRYRVDVDPREDALLALELWKLGISGQQIRYGRGNSGYVRSGEASWQGAEGGSFECTDLTRHKLTGGHSLNSGWHEFFAQKGGWVERDEVARRIFELQEAIHKQGKSVLDPLRPIAALLYDAGEIPVGASIPAEVLLAGIQCAPPLPNVRIRERLVTGGYVTKQLRVAFGWGLYQAFKPELVNVWRQRKWEKRLMPHHRSPELRQFPLKEVERDRIEGIAGRPI
nr:Uncharacterised protein [Streptococcus thermophilus]